MEGKLIRLGVDVFYYSILVDSSFHFVLDFAKLSNFTAILNLILVPVF